jgi:hypothetical protein
VCSGEKEMSEMCLCADGLPDVGGGVDGMTGSCGVAERERWERWLEACGMDGVERVEVYRGGAFREDADVFVIVGGVGCEGACIVDAVDAGEVLGRAVEAVTYESEEAEEDAGANAVSSCWDLDDASGAGMGVVASSSSSAISSSSLTSSSSTSAIVSS